MKKTVAVGIAGVTAVVVAAWRRIQRDNTLETDAPAAPAPQNTAPTPSSTTKSSAAAAGSLFTPSVDAGSTKAELYEVATDMGIEGRSKMTKSELLDAIRSAS